MVDQGNSENEHEDRRRSEGLDESKTGETPDDIDLAAEMLMLNISGEAVPGRIERLARQLQRELQERDGEEGDGSPGDRLD